MSNGLRDNPSNISEQPLQFAGNNRFDDFGKAKALTNACRDRHTIVLISLYLRANSIRVDITVTSYEIRIVRKDGQSLKIALRVMGDHAAIRRAQMLAIDGDIVEVWRGMVCIFDTAADMTVH